MKFTLSLCMHEHKYISWQKININLINQTINKLLKGAGTVRLERHDIEDGTYVLDLMYDHGFAMLLSADTEGDVETYGTRKTLTGEGPFEILGDYYDEGLLLDDLNLAYEVFAHFFQTGNLDLYASSIE